MSDINNPENAPLSMSRQYGRRNLAPSTPTTTLPQSQAIATAAATMSPAPTSTSPSPSPLPLSHPRSHPAKPFSDAIEAALSDILPPFTGPLYTAAQLLMLCPLKPTRSSLPFPASVAELFDQVTIDIVMKNDPLSSQRSSTEESDYELPRPALKMKLSPEDQQLFKASVLSGNTRRPPTGNNQNQDRTGARFENVNNMTTSQRGAYSNASRGRGRGTDRQQQQQGNSRYPQRTYPQGAAGEDGANSPEWIETRRHHQHHHHHPQQHDDRRSAGSHATRDSGDLWANPKDVIGRFDENGRFITTVGSPSPQLPVEEAPLERMKERVMEREATKTTTQSMPVEEPAPLHTKPDVSATKSTIKQSRFANIIPQENESILSGPADSTSLWQSFTSTTSASGPTMTTKSSNQVEASMTTRMTPSSAFDPSIVSTTKMTDSFAAVSLAQENLPLFANWTYCDPSGRIQGPFSWEHMRDWTAAGYFTPTLLIKPEASGGIKSALIASHLTESFNPLSKWVERYGDLGFWTPEAKSVKEKGLKGKIENAPPAKPAIESTSSKSGLMMPTSVIGRTNASQHPVNMSTSTSTHAATSSSPAVPAMDSAILSAKVKPATFQSTKAHESVALQGNEGMPSFEAASVSAPRASWAPLPAATKAVKSLKEIEAELAVQQLEHQASAKAAAMSQNIASSHTTGAPWATAKSNASVTAPLPSFSDVLKEAEAQGKMRDVEGDGVGVGTKTLAARTSQDTSKSWAKGGKEDSAIPWANASTQRKDMSTVPVATPTAHHKAAPSPLPSATLASGSSSSWSSIAATKNAQPLSQSQPHTQASLAQKSNATPPAPAPMATATAAISTHATLSSKHATQAATETESTESAQAAPSEELVEWVRGELRKLKLKDLDVPTLVSYIYELPANELLEIMGAYIPSSSAVNAFVDGFIRTRGDKAFNTEKKPSAHATKKSPNPTGSTVPSPSAKQSMATADSDDGFSVVTSRKPKKTVAPTTKPTSGSGTGGRKVVGLA